MSPLARILISLSTIALVAGCATHNDVFNSTPEAVVLRSINLGQIDFKPDIGRLQYGGKLNPDGSVAQTSKGHLLEDNNDLYVLYEEGNGRPAGTHFYAYGIKTRKVKKLKHNAAANSVKKLAQLNNMKALTMIEPRRTSKCLEMTDKTQELDSAHCWNNPLMPARHGISIKHQYYFTSTNQANDDDGVFTIEYIDYSKFGAKTGYIEDIVEAIELRKKVLVYRDQNTFDGFMAAYEISSDFADLESAQSLAINRSQKSTLSTAMQLSSDTSKQDKLVKVAEAQTILKYGGYYQMTIDGIYGPGSTKAIREFQADYKLPINGKLDSRTIRRLSKFKKEWDKQSQWRVIGESFLSKVINGKTLVASHKALCQNDEPLVPCTKIAVLSKKSRDNKVDGLYKATIIDPQLKTIEQSVWGTGDTLIRSSNVLNVGLLEIRRESGNLIKLNRSNGFANAVAINNKNNALKVRMHDYPQQHLIINIEEPSGDHLAYAEKRKYKNIDTKSKPIANAPAEKLSEKTVLDMRKTGTQINGFDKYKVSCSHKNNNEVVWFNTESLYWENKVLRVIPKLYGEQNATASEVAAFICSR